MLRKVLALGVCFSLIFTQSGLGQGAAELNLGNYFSLEKNTLEKFRPPHLRYFSYDHLNNQFQILLDQGDAQEMAAAGLKDKAGELLNYFLIGVTLPNAAFWVNLRPDADDEIIDAYLGRTDIGKIFLETDLQLKKDTARFTSPETPEGRVYWDKLYRKAEELFGSENVVIPTFTRPWIVPGEIIIREGADSAYIYKATLKVMLEQDYLSGVRGQGSGSSMYDFKDPRLKALNEYSSEMIRKTIIPKLTKEVNTSKRYASLRQVFYSLILSRWFKEHFKGQSPSGTVPNLIDTRELTNLTSKQNWSKTTYFKEYQKSFKDGEYNLQETAYSPYGQVIRSYFSGGIDVTEGAAASPARGNFRGASEFLRALVRHQHMKLFIGEGQRGLREAVGFSAASPAGKSMEEGRGKRDAAVTTGAASPVENSELTFYINAGIIKKDVRNSGWQVCANWSPTWDHAEFWDFYSDLEEALEAARDVLADLEPLYAYLKVLKTIQGSRGNIYTADELIETIKEVRRGERSINSVTRANEDRLAAGLRDVVANLLQKDTASPSSHPKIIDENIKKIQEDIERGFYIDGELHINGLVNGEGEIVGLREVISENECFEKHLYGFSLVMNKKDELSYHLHDVFGGPAPQKVINMLAETIREANKRKGSSPLRSELSARSTGAISPAEKKTISSPTEETEDPDKLAGIDFRTMNILAQPMGNFSGLSFKLPKIANVEKINLDEELKQLKLMVERGRVPSAERLKEFVAAAFAKQELAERIDGLLLCLVDICRLEEELVAESSPALKEVLVIVDTNKFVL